MASGAIIRIEQLTKTYDLGEVQLTVLRSLSLSISPGSFVAIMGASGSGKSTLLNILGCLDRPTSGRYVLAGMDVSDMGDDELSDMRGQRIGFVFQQYNLIDQLSVVENIHVPLAYQGLGLSECRDRCEALAHRVGLSDRLGHRPKQLSGGQQQRVALARSLANDPVMILADEPTGNLDSSTGREILDLFSELHAQGKTIVMVTHGDEVAARATRVVQMSDGRIVRDVSRAQREMAGA